MTAGTAYQRLVDALERHGSTVRVNGSSAMAQCPAHEDRNPSLSLRPIETQALLHCFAGCHTDDVLAAIGFTTRDLYDEPKGTSYTYTGPTGTPTRVVHRSPEKSFRQTGDTSGQPLLYRLPEVVAAVAAGKTIFVTEGEKDVHALEALGAVATTSPMGARSWGKVDASPLKGAHVVVVPDNDPAGQEYLTDVLATLRDTTASLRVVHAKEGKDAADHVAAGYGLDDLVPVDLESPAAVLLEELCGTIKNYVVLPSEHALDAVTLWIAATHALPAFQHAPRLVIKSPEKRCGKSRLLDVVAGTCHEPLMSINATVAAIFRSIGGEHPPTLLVDEADALFGSKRAAEQNEDLRALLNAGHQRGRPALRCVGPMQTPTEFPTFSMAALAGIGELPDTITDRAVCITMRRRLTGEQVSQFRTRRDGPVLHQLRDRLASWAVGQIGVLTDAEPDMPVDDRAADTWEPLVAVADLAGGTWPARARRACLVLTAASEAADEEASLSTKLLADVRAVFTGRRASFVATSELVAALTQLEDSPWGDFDFNARKVAYRLKDFGVRPGFNTAKTARGYRLEDMTDAFNRYLRPDPSDPSETASDLHVQPDASRSPDGSIRPVEKKRPEETAGQDGSTDGWTLPDGPVDGPATLPTTSPGGGDDPLPAARPLDRCPIHNQPLAPGIGCVGCAVEAAGP